MKEGIRSIQFLRFIAATLVVLSHSMLAANDFFDGGVSRATLYFANVGGSGVHIFFVISGFIMVFTSFGREKNVFHSDVFLIRRFIRIYPIYWIYATLYVLLHQIALGGYGLSASDIFRSFLLLPGYSPLIIGPGWTLSFEVYFYICFGIFMSLGLLRGLTVMTLFFAASIMIGLALHSDNPAIHVVTDTLLIEFLAGAWIAYLFVAGIKIGNGLSNVLLALALAGFLGGFAYGYHRLPSILMWGVPSALLIAGLVFKEREGHLANFVQRLSFLGDSSYSLYLLHILLLDIFFRAFLVIFPNSGFAYLAICSVLTVLCIIVALLLYELIERRVVSSLQFLAKGIFARRMKEAT